MYMKRLCITVGLEIAKIKRILAETFVAGLIFFRAEHRICQVTLKCSVNFAFPKFSFHMLLRVLKA